MSESDAGPDSDDIRGEDELEHALSLLGPEIEDPQAAAEAESDAVIERLRGLRLIEQLLVRADRLFLSQGARLMLFLPQLIALVVGLAVWKEHRSPTWWRVFGETVFELEFTPFMDWLSVVFLLAMLLMLGISITQAMISRHVFTDESLLSELREIPLSESTGFLQIENLTLFAIKHRSLAAMITMTALLLQMMVLYRGSFDVTAEIIRVFSLSLVLTNFGVLMLREDRMFNTAESWGLLQAYEAEKHEEVLLRPFSELLLAHTDPLMRRRLEVLVRGDDDITAREGFEDLVIWHFLHDDGRMTSAELRERVAGHVVLNDDPIAIDFDLWSELIRHLRARCVPFIRLVDRTLQKTAVDVLSPDALGYHFDVDIDDIFEGRGSIAAQLINASDQLLKATLIIESPHISPQRIEHRIELEPRHVELKALAQMRFETDLARREQVMRTASRSSRWIWMSTSALASGEMVLNVRLEDEGGDLIDGRTLISISRMPMMMRFRRTTGRGALLIALLLPIIRLGWWGFGLY